jgi:structural maintenance of chromosome 4
MVLEKFPQINLEKTATPENVPRLFNLMKLKEPRFAAAFYKGVRDTLVLDDLDQANRIAFGGQKRWRVVTLAGQLIDASGTMSGGGNQVSRGGMSSKLAKDPVTPSALKALEKESEDATKELDEALQNLPHAETEVDNLRKSGFATDLALQKLSLDIRTGLKGIAEAERRVKELKYGLNVIPTMLY